MDLAERGSTIVEIKETLAGERKEFACTLLASSPGEAVVGYRIPREGRVEDLTLPAGALTVAYFWESRPYNAYHWVTPGGDTIGLYFNVSDRTRITSHQVHWRDLVVDVLLTSDGRCRVLDEDELGDDVDAALGRRIEATREALCREPHLRLQELEVRTRELLATSGNLPASR